MNPKKKKVKIIVLIGITIGAEALAYVLFVLLGGYTGIKNWILIAILVLAIVITGWKAEGSWIKKIIAIVALMAITAIPVLLKVPEKPKRDPRTVILDDYISTDAITMEISYSSLYPDLFIYKDISDISFDRWKSDNRDVYVAEEANFDDSEIHMGVEQMANKVRYQIMHNPFYGYMALKCFEMNEEWMDSTRVAEYKDATPLPLLDLTDAAFSNKEHPIGFEIWLEKNTVTNATLVSADYTFYAEKICSWLDRLFVEYVDDATLTHYWSIDEKKLTTMSKPVEHNKPLTTSGLLFRYITPADQLGGSFFFSLEQNVAGIIYD